MRKFILSAGMFGAVALASGAAYSQECFTGYGHHEGAPHHGKMAMHRGQGPMFFNPERMQKKLGLSDEQTDRIADINEKAHKEREAVMDKVRPAERALGKVLRSDSPDLAKAQPLVNELAGYRAQLQMIGIRHRIEVGKVLTDEQRRKLQDGGRTEKPKRKGNGGMGFAPDMNEDQAPFSEPEQKEIEG